jgi:hypothetical protein
MTIEELTFALEIIQPRIIFLEGCPVELLVTFSQDCGNSHCVE